MTDGLDDYFRRTFEQKLLVCVTAERVCTACVSSLAGRNVPERDDGHLTAATRLLEKRREMVETQEVLSTQKEEFHVRMEALRQRRLDLERKEYQLKESLIKFDKFLKVRRCHFWSPPAEHLALPSSCPRAGERRQASASQPQGHGRARPT
jgi:hypothetical protein